MQPMSMSKTVNSPLHQFSNHQRILPQLKYSIILLSGALTLSMVTTLVASTTSITPGANIIRLIPDEPLLAILE